MSETLKVYVKPGCPWCVDAEAWLKREGYQYDRVDVYKDPAAYDEMQRLSGQSCAPTLTFGDLLLADFGVPELEAFLEANEIHP